MRQPTEVPILASLLKRPLVLLALLALLVSQAAAGLHALNHFGKQGDPLGVPGHHAQLCHECASFAPLAALHGASITALTIANLGTYAIPVAAGRVLADLSAYFPFRSRAPPR
jgi:hypothetical protein